MLRISEYRKVLGEDGKSIKLEKIDLKELEKFGFFQDYLVDTTVYRKVIKKEIGLLKQECEIIVWKENRDIDVYTTKGLLDDILYDLIKADMVERI